MVEMFIILWSFLSFESVGCNSQPPLPTSPLGDSCTRIEVWNESGKYSWYNTQVWVICLIFVYMMVTILKHWLMELITFLIFSCTGSKLFWVLSIPNSSFCVAFTYLWLLLKIYLSYNCYCCDNINEYNGFGSNFLPIN